MPDELPAKKALYQLLRTKKDINGNSRSLYVVYSTLHGDIIAIIEAGAEGHGALTSWAKREGVDRNRIEEIMAVDISPSFYQALRKHHRYYQPRKTG